MVKPFGVNHGSDDGIGKELIEMCIRDRAPDNFKNDPDVKQFYQHFQETLQRNNGTMEDLSLIHIYFLKSGRR